MRQVVLFCYISIIKQVKINVESEHREFRGEIRVSMSCFHVCVSTSYKTLTRALVQAPVEASAWVHFIRGAAEVLDA